MPVWILLVVAAQFINALVALIDKYVVSSPDLPRPFAYAFYISTLSAFSVCIFLFEDISIPLDGVAMPSFSNVAAPTLSTLLVSLCAGATFFGALVSLFSGLRRAGASDVVPVVGATSAITAFLLSYFLLDDPLAPNFALGFVLLIIGTLILSFFRFGLPTLALSIASGALFGTHFVILEVMFLRTHFDDAFFWSRMGIVVIALALFLTPFLRRRLAIKSATARRRASAYIVGNKLLAGLASIMILKAIELGDVAVVQALGGLQFAFLLVFAAVFNRGLPKVCGEKCSPYQLVHKTVGVIIIIIGFAALFL